MLLFLNFEGACLVFEAYFGYLWAEGVGKDPFDDHDTRLVVRFKYLLSLDEYSVFKKSVIYVHLPGRLYDLTTIAKVFVGQWVKQTTFRVSILRFGEKRAVISVNGPRAQPIALMVAK